MVNSIAAEEVLNTIENKADAPQQQDTNDNGEDVTHKTKIEEEAQPQEQTIATPPESATGKDEGDKGTDEGPTVPGPTDTQLHTAVYALRQETPTLGILKLLVKLKEANSNWQLSEKRLRKFLSQHSTLSVANQSQRGAPSEPLWIPDYDWERDYEDGRGFGFVSSGPQSSLDDTLLLECKTDTCKVEPVRFEEANKGSGLIAKSKLMKGAQVFKESAYVWVPYSKSLSRQITSGHACAYCGRIFATTRLRTQVPCPHHPAPGSKKAKAAQSVSKSTSANGDVITEKPDGPEPCYQKFCTRVCATKSVADFGPLVCPQMNPEYSQVLRQADQEDSRCPHLVFKLWVKMLIANEGGEALDEGDGQDANGDGEVEEHRGSDDKLDANESGDIDQQAEGGAAVKKSKKTKGKKKTGVVIAPETMPPSQEMTQVINRIGGLATISDRARREQASNHLGMQLVEYRFGQTWKLAWHIIVRALHLNTGYRTKPEPGSTEEFWSGFWKKRLSPQLIVKMFGISTFLDMLGKMSLNQESDSGLYLLHSRINHSCEPNCATVKTVSSEDRSKVAPSIIYIVTRRDIEPDEELTLSYVAPDTPLEPRRKKLYDEYCFSCFCTRCRRELKEAEDKVAEEEGSSIRDIDAATDDQHPGLREELLAHFRG